MKLMINSDSPVFFFHGEVAIEYRKQKLVVTETAIVYFTTEKMNYILKHMWWGEYWCDEKDGDGGENDNESRQIHDSPTFIHCLQQPIDSEGR